MSEPTTSTTNGAATTDPRVAWPSRAEAARLLHVHHSTIRRWERSGELSPVLVDGVQRFDPDELAEVRLLGDGNALNADLLNSAAALLRQAYAHNERLLDLYSKPMEAMASHSARMQERAEQLEAKNTEMLAASEEALSLQHERHLRELEHQAKERRKDRGLEAVLGQLRNLSPVFEAWFVRQMASFDKTSGSRAQNGAVTPERPTTPTAPMTQAAVPPNIGTANAPKPAAPEPDDGEPADPNDPICLALGFLERRYHELEKLGATPEERAGVLAILSSAGIEPGAAPTTLEPLVTPNDAGPKGAASAASEATSVAAADTAEAPTKMRAKRKDAP